MDKQSNKTNTIPNCCCPLTPATLAPVREMSVWIGGHWLWPPCSLIGETLKLHWQNSHCGAKGTSSRAQSLRSEMLSHCRSQALIYNTLCVSICLHASASASPSARQSVSVDLNGSSVCDHTDGDGWRNTDAGGQVILRLDSAIPGMPWSLWPCPPYDTEDKMSTQAGEEPPGEMGEAVFPCGSRRLRGVGGADGCSITGKVICQSSLRSTDIHHIVCEKHCANVFSAHPLSTQSE